MEIKTVSIKNTDLKELRKRAGLSYRKLGGLSGVPFQKIYHCENGYYSMDQGSWDKIKKVLDEYNQKNNKKL